MGEANALAFPSSCNLVLIAVNLVLFRQRRGAAR